MSGYTQRPDHMSDQIFIEALQLDARIGVFEHEYDTTQRVQFDLEIDLSPPGKEGYTLSNIVRYDRVVDDIRSLVTSGHIELVEMMAEKVAAIVLNYDGVARVTVRVSKLSAISEARGVGIRISRSHDLGFTRE